MPVHHHQQLLENYIQSLGCIKDKCARDLEVKSLAHHIDADSCSREDGEGGESRDWQRPRPREAHLLLETIRVSTNAIPPSEEGDG